MLSGWRQTESNGIIQNADDYTVVGTWTHFSSDRLVNQLRVKFAADNYRELSLSPESTQIVRLEIGFVPPEPRS